MAWRKAWCNFGGMYGGSTTEEECCGSMLAKFVLQVRRGEAPGTTSGGYQPEPKFFPRCKHHYVMHPELSGKEAL